MNETNISFRFFSKIAKNWDKELEISQNLFKKNKEKSNLINASLYDNLFKNPFSEENEKNISIKKDIFENIVKLKKINHLYKNNEKIKKHKFYHDIHLQKIKDNILNIKNQKKFELVYEWNIDNIKKRTPSGPKWEYQTGRQKLNKSSSILISSNNSIHNNSNNSKISKSNSPKKVKKIKKINLKKHKKLTTNLIKKPNTKLTTQNNISVIAKEKNIKKKKKLNQIKILKRDRSMINIDTTLLLPKLYNLDEGKVNENKFFLQKRFPPLRYANPDEIKNKNKIIISKVKKFKGSKILGLNMEQLEFIDSIQRQKSNKSITKVKKRINSCLDIRKKNLDESSRDYNVNDSSFRQKSFNCYINKNLYYYKRKETDNKKSIIKNIKILKNEFYNFNCDKISNYDFPIFDNVTYKTIPRIKIKFLKNK